MHKEMESFTLTQIGRIDSDMSSLVFISAENKDRAQLLVTLLDM